MIRAPSIDNPCIRCGACCATYRVQFYWREASDDTPAGVPLEFCEELDSFRRCMKGTNQKHNSRCVCLVGNIGKLAFCSIYDKRPTPCRNFPASFADGKINRRCDQARARHGLPPLKPEDWREALADDRVEVHP